MCPAVLALQLQLVFYHVSVILLISCFTSCTNKPNSSIFMCRLLCCICYCCFSSPGFPARLSTGFALIYPLSSHWGLGMLFTLCFLLSDIPLSLIYLHWPDFTFFGLKEGDDSIAVTPVSILPMHCLLQFKTLPIYHGRLCPGRVMFQRFRWDKSLENTLFHGKALFCNIHYVPWQQITILLLLLSFLLGGVFFL